MNASDKLDDIREGGQTLIAIAFARLSEAAELLREGRFNDAAQVAAEAHQRIANLAQAETYLASFKGLLLKRAEDLAEGDVVFQFGPVTTVEHETHHEGQPGAHTIVKLAFRDGGEAANNARDEVLVVQEED